MGLSPVARVIARLGLIVAVIGMTAACASAPIPTPVACPAALITGVLEPLGPPGSIGIAAGPRHLIVTWVDGYRSAELNGSLVVLSPEGAVVARAGDRVELTGGELRAGEWTACGPPLTPRTRQSG